MGLYQKMHNVMVESEGLEKNMTVGEGKNAYKAISEAEVLNTIKPLLKKHGLVLFPVETSITEEFKEYESKYGTSQRFLSTLNAKYKIVDIETGEFEILSTVGYGADSQDKASGKAMTYAYKALIQKTFMLFSGEDTETTSSEQIEKDNATDGFTRFVSLEELLAKAKEKKVTPEQILDRYNKNMGEKEQITELSQIGEQHRLAMYKLLNKVK